MKTPWTLDGERVRISTPTYPWEKHGDLANAAVKHVDVNEAPQALPHDGRLFMAFSASGCWTDNYCLGLLALKPGGDPADPADWKKGRQPLLGSSPDANAYAPGHNSFFQSPDGREDWIVYHANLKAGQGCGKARSPRAQPLHWRADGLPDLGPPAGTGVPLPSPSGE